MVFDPLVEAIRGALRALDADPRNASCYFILIEAYQECADKESEPELLEQAEYVIRDAKRLPLTAEEALRLAGLELRVSTSLQRLRAGDRKA
jgi:hypothetical protein